MKSILGFALAIVLVFASLPVATAQESSSAYANGPGEQAVYINEAGVVEAGLTVTEYIADYEDFPDGEYPNFGFRYVAVAFDVENLSDSAIIVEPVRFSIYDSHGNSYFRTQMRTGNADLDRYNEPYALSPGEVASTMLIFSIPADTEGTVLTWQPEYSTMVMVNLMTEETVSGSISEGLNTPATITDEFGNVVATVQITELMGDWGDYDEYYAPSEGETYWAIRFSLTNETNRPISVSPLRFALIDSEGVYVLSDSVRTSDDADYEIYRTEDVDPGETLEGIVVFPLAEESTPIAFQWTSSGLNPSIIFLAERDRVEPAATPSGG